MYYKVKISILALVAISLIGCNNSYTTALAKPFDMSKVGQEIFSQMSQRVAFVKIVNGSKSKLYDVDLRQISYADHNGDGIIQDEERVDASVKLYEQLDLNETKTIIVGPGIYYIRYHMDSNGGNIIGDRSYPYRCWANVQETHLGAAINFKLSWANDHCQ